MTITVRWNELNGAEKALVEAIKNNESWWPSPEFLLAASKKRNVSRSAGDGDVRPTVRAKVLRAILTGAYFEQPKGTSASAGQPIAIGPGGLSISPPNVDVAGPPVRVRVEGALDLNGLCGPGGTVTPPIILEYCDFDSTIDIRGAHIAALSLAGSRFSALRLTDAEVRGRVDLSWCEPTDGPPGMREEGVYATAELDSLWPFAGNSFERRADAASGIGTAFHPLTVETPDPARPLPQCIALLGNTSIDGNVDIYGARFIRRHDALDPFRNDGTRVTEALSLAGTVIAGTVRCIRTVVIGGIALRDAHVRENIRFASSRLLSYDGDVSIDLQMARCDGLVGFSTNEDKMVLDYPLLARRADLSINVVVGRIGGLGLSARYLWVSDAVIIAGGADASVGITLDNADIAGSIWLGAYLGSNDASQSVTQLGAVSLIGARIGNNLHMAHYGAQRANLSSAVRLVAVDTPFMRNFMRYHSVYDGAYCRLDLGTASIGNEIRIDHSWLHASVHDTLVDCSAINVAKADIGKGLLIGETVRLEGAVCLQQARIGRLVKIACRSIRTLMPEGVHCAAIEASGASIDGDVTIGAAAGLAIDGTVCLDSIDVKGCLALHQCRFDLPGASPRPQNGDEATIRTLSLAGARIAGKLSVKALHWKRKQPPAPEPVPDVIVQARRDKTSEVARSLPFFKDIVLVEYGRKVPRSQIEPATAGTPGGNVQVDVRRQLLYDQRGKRAWQLDGRSDPIHQIRGEPGRFQLGNEALEQQYLTFFCEAVQGEDGCFRLVADVLPDTVRFPDPDERKDGEDGAEPSATLNPMLDNHPLGALLRQPLDDGRASYYATVLYGKYLFNAQFAVSADGMIEMIDDKPIAEMIVPPVLDKGIDRTATPPPGITFHEFGSSIDVPHLTSARVVSTADLNLGLPPVIDIDLEQLHCGMLDDGFGDEWAFIDRQVIRLAGIQTAECEPSAEARSRGSGDRGRFFSSTGLVERMQDEDPHGNLGSKFDEATGKSGGGAAAAARKRLDWLKRQFPAKRGTGFVDDIFGWLLPSRWLGEEQISPNNFVPHTWDMFANAHLRAGEAPSARALMTERKDIEARVLSQEARAWVYGVGPAFDPNESVKTERWRDFRLRALSVVCPASLLLLALWFLQWPWAFTLDHVAPLAVFGLGAVAFAIGLSPLLLLIGAWLFRFGFRYGLSAPRAIVTFFSFIAIGALGTHIARTGEAISLSTDWRALTDSEGRLDRDIALVLAAGYSANAPASSPTAPLPARPGAGPLQGTLVYGAAAPCNLGVSSWQYAMDVFIPVLDLDQESRCSIREEPESTGSYNGWRWLKILYEIMGWIVTSLTILTITGVMRRDMER